MFCYRKQIRNFIRRRLEHGKDAYKSKSLRQIGNEHYAKENYVNAMVRYNESIEFAPDDSLEYATALANRSTVLFQLQRYKVTEFEQVQITYIRTGLDK